MTVKEVLDQKEEQVVQNSKENINFNTCNIFNSSDTISTSTITTPLISKDTSLMKLNGFDFWRTTLKSAKFIVAPMVDQSELAWRILGRRYGAELCYTPMFNSRLFSENANYRSTQFTTDSHDRPLIVQFCGDNPETILKAAKFVEDHCDAVDINLGCPQHIARRGHYGSFLQDEWDLIASIVKNLNENLKVPVTCKIRVFPDVEKTVRYAKMIESAGAQMLTVHGRLREQKGHNTGLADWTQIKRVVEAVKIPVIANGNILSLEDCERCIAETGAVGVMSAEAHLYNPAIFSGKSVFVWDMVTEYLQICKDIPTVTPISFIRGHLFKMFRKCLDVFTDHRTRLGNTRNIEEIESVAADLCNDLRTRYEALSDFERLALDSATPHDRIHNDIYHSSAYIRPDYAVNCLVPIKESIENENEQGCTLKRIKVEA